MSSASSRLQIKLLGQTAVLLGESDVTDSIRPKSLNLLKVLASHPRHTLSREALAETLWPNSSPDAAFLSLKVTAHYLRRALARDSNEPREWIATRRGMYSLSEDVHVDADEFEQCVRAGMAMKAAERAHEAREAFERAVTLYRGDYLPDDSYEDWAVMSRERLRDQYLHALEQVATMAMEEQNYPRVIDAAHRLIQVDPCREDMYCLLMGAHGALGQNTRARAWYDLARRTMRAELDRDVSSRTKDVYAAVQGNRLPA